MGSKTGQERRKLVLGLLGSDKMKEKGFSPRGHTTFFRVPTASHSEEGYALLQSFSESLLACAVFV